MLTLFGLILILVSLQDQFQSLFHPAGHGIMSDWIARLVWKIYRVLSAGRPTALTLAGPSAVLGIITTWGALIAVGCSLIYYSHRWMFQPPPGMEGLNHGSYLQAFNLSLASLVTMSTHLTPTKEWIRTVMTLEAVLGIGLLTASVSWLLSLYPVLEARNSLAQQAMSIYEAECATRADALTLGEAHVESMLFDLSGQLTNVRNQTVQFPITYYFGVANERSSMARALSFIRELALRAKEPDRPQGIQFAGDVLNRSVTAYLQLLANEFLHISSQNEQSVIWNYAADNLRRPAVQP